MTRHAPQHLFHLAEATNLASILTHGLLSTACLIDRCGIAEHSRTEILRQHRTDNLPLPNGVLIRDQKPMPPKALAPALAVGLTPADWYQHLNHFVFLWPDRARMERQRGACRPRAQVVLVFEAAALLQDFASAVFVSPINSGNARRRAARRGLDTIIPHNTWIEYGWTKAGDRPDRRKPAEYLLSCPLPVRPPYLVAIERDGLA